MPTTEFTLHHETPADLAELLDLHARALGPGRFARTAYRVREGGGEVPSLSFVARNGERLAGGIRFTAVAVGGKPGALMLGPLVVEPEFAGKGCGRKLIARGLEAAREEGFALVILVGDRPYYERFGFRPVPRGHVAFPGPVDPDRILAVELAEGALARLQGKITALRDTR